MNKITLALIAALSTTVISLPAQALTAKQILEQRLKKQAATKVVNKKVTTKTTKRVVSKGKVVVSTPTVTVTKLPTVAVTTVTTTTATAVVTKPVTISTANGNTVVPANGTSVDAANSATAIQSKNMNTLVIEGKTFDLAETKPAANGISTKKDGKNVLNVGHNLKNAKYGNYVIAGNTYKGVGFYQGNETAVKDMPTTGTAKYKGAAVQAALDVRTAKVTPTVAGTSEFDVNFGTKSLTGTITPADKNFAKVNVAATINGNGFSGVKGNTVVQGQFYGEKAAEMAGTYDVMDTSSKIVNGSFGATKQ